MFVCCKEGRRIVFSDCCVMLFLQYFCCQCLTLVQFYEISLDLPQLVLPGSFSKILSNFAGGLSGNFHIITPSRVLTFTSNGEDPDFAKYYGLVELIFLRNNTCFVLAVNFLPEHVEL